MNLLLDTHIWLWSLLEPERLAEPVAAALVDETNQLWLSPISIWEFLLLAERGRLRFEHEMAPAAWVEAALSRAPMHDAALSREVAVRSRALRIEHDDPADRFLAATANVYKLTLVTADERLLRGQGFRTLANQCPVICGAGGFETRPYGPGLRRRREGLQPADHLPRD